MKIYMMTDLEGVAGVSQWRDCNSKHEWYYRRSRRLLTREVGAACEGALAAGARDIVVWDGHGSGGIDVEDLHPRARLLAGRGSMKSRALGMDGGFDGVFFIAQHAMNRVQGANLCHTYSSLGISNMWLNGMRVGEFGLRTVLAGYLDIPVVLLTGDDLACREAEDMVPGIETVAVKESYGREYALSFSPEQARERIREGAERAVRRISEIEPYRMDSPYELRVEPYDRSACEEGDRSFDRPVGEVQVSRSDDFLEVAR